jgi:hypothetical protein
MKYTLITSSGKVLSFYTKELAEIYQIIKGGVLISPDSLCEDELEVVE